MAKGAIEYTSDQIENVEDNENYVCDEYMHQRENGDWYFEIPVVTVTTEQRISEIQKAVQTLLDSKAQEKLYDDGFAIASYATSSDAIFRAEATAFVEWRDHCWRTCYNILGEFQSGEIEMPTVEYVLSQLPVLDWNSIQV